MGISNSWWIICLFLSQDMFSVFNVLLLFNASQIILHPSTPILLASYIQIFHMRRYTHINMLIVFNHQIDSGKSRCYFSAMLLQSFHILQLQCCSLCNYIIVIFSILYFPWILCHNYLCHHSTYTVQSVKCYSSMPRIVFCTLHHPRCLQYRHNHHSLFILSFDRYLL